ncbi:hypothetical protein EJB05_52492, partial [Eragrostis curvula]
MNYVKNKLRNNMGDQYLNDCLVTFLELDFFLQTGDEDIVSPWDNGKSFCPASAKINFGHKYKIHTSQSA